MEFKNTYNSNRNGFSHTSELYHDNGNLIATIGILTTSSIILIACVISGIITLLK